jgi:hypothetical protein
MKVRWRHKYIEAIRGSIFALLGFCGLLFIVPPAKSDDLELILSISTFLFAILLGFFISRSNNRYNNINELIGAEDGLFLSLYETSHVYGKKFAAKMADLIDSYYIESYDHPLGKHYKPTSPLLHKMYRLVESVPIKSGSRQDNMFDDVLGILRDVEEARNKSAVITDVRLSRGQWMVLILLAGVVISNIYLLRGAGIYSAGIAVLLSTILALVLFILRDLENFRLGGKLLLEESGEELFEAIGKKRYYVHRLLEEGTVTVPDHVTEYRLGMHNPGEKHNIKHIKRKKTRP